MVNFGQKLRDNVREQWKEYYLDYAALKRTLKQNRKQLGHDDEGSDSDEDAGGAPKKAGKKKQASTPKGGGGNGGVGEEGRGLLGDKDKRRPGYDATTGVAIEEGGAVDFGKRFKEEMVKELTKVGNFYDQTLDDFCQQFACYKGQMRLIASREETTAEIPTLPSVLDFRSLEKVSSESGIDREPMKKDEIQRLRKNLDAKEKDSIQRFLMRLNREMVLLRNFCILNYTGFIKIVKKHDKMNESHPLKSEVNHMLDRAEFSKRRRLEALVDEVTKVFADVFCNSDKEQASAMMLPKRSTAQTDYFLLHLGYRLGVAATLAIWVVWDCVVQVAKFGKPTIVAKLAFPVYRAVGGLLLLHWCWGLVEWVCDTLRINYVFLLDLHPKNVSSPRRIFDTAVNESIFYLTSLLLYYKVLVGGFPEWLPAGMYPLLLMLYTLWKLLTPWKQKVGLWVTIGKVVVSPLYRVNLLDTIVADMLTSLVKVLLDLAWSVFYFGSGDFLRDVRGADEAGLATWERAYYFSKVLSPVVVILPLWWRFMQCLRRYWDTGNRWPHLANALKYAISQMVTLFGAFHHVYYRRSSSSTRTDSVAFDIIWVFITAVSTLYSYLWDVTIDWGLGRPDKKFLNDRRMFHRTLPYYFAIASDLALRFLWVNTLIPPGSGGLLSLPLYLNAMLVVLEILRRSGWAILRLENEHLRNTQGFRRVDVIPLAFATEAKHDYKEPNRPNNLKVVVEVALVAGLVVFLSIGAVVVADGLDRAQQDHP